LGHKLCIERYGDEDKPVTILIPTSKMDHIIPALLYSGQQVIVVNYPGIGDSPGKPLNQRSEQVLVKGGAGDMMMDVLEQLGLKNKKVAVGGYDWGSTVALRIAAHWPNRFSHVIAFHPSMGADKKVKDELAKIKANVLVLWVPADMFHPWSKWKSVPACI